MYGSASGLSEDGEQLLLSRGQAQFGSSLSVSSLNGDEFADLVIHSGTQDTAEDVRPVIFFGSEAGLRD